MKKYLAMLLAVVMVLSLAACGGKTEAPAATAAPAPDAPAATEATEAPKSESKYPSYFDGMDDLIAAAQAEGELTVYGSCEEEYLAAACQHFQEVFGIKVNYQRLSTGEVQAKIEEEKGNPSADVCSAICTRIPMATGTASTRASWASWSTPMSWPG